MTTKITIDNIEVSTLAGSNNFVKYDFPIDDHGFVGPNVGLSDEVMIKAWDNKLSAQPQEWGYNFTLPKTIENNTITLDAGFLT
jgi:hypothetical protein